VYTVLLLALVYFLSMICYEFMTIFDDAIDNYIYSGSLEKRSGSAP